MQRYLNGELVDMTTEEVAAFEAERAARQPTLSVRKAQALAKLDADAEAVRLKYLTPGVGMVMTYQEKFAQAQAVNTLGAAAANALTPTEREAQYPTLAASVGIEAATLFECATLVLQRYVAFAQLSRVIERTRLTAKKAIAAAATPEDVAAAYAAATWNA